MKETLTLKSLNKKLDDFILEVRGYFKQGTPIPEPVEEGVDLSTYTEIGCEVEVESLGKIRLLDTNYNGTGKKIWQFVDVLKPNEIYLGLPNDENNGGYPNAVKLQARLKEMYYYLLPKWLRHQIVSTDISCYIPEKQEIEMYEANLFLLSLTEICQNRPCGAKEGRPLEFYINNTPSFNDWQWLRSASPSHAYSWCSVYSGGFAYTDNTYNAHGVAPAFCTD